jgi:hypothetical protein
MGLLTWWRRHFATPPTPRRPTPVRAAVPHEDPDLSRARERRDRLLARARSLGIDGDVVRRRERAQWSPER